MTPKEFQEAWNAYENNLQPISLQTLGRFNLDSTTVEFLFASGLPVQADPCLSFVGDVNNGDKYSIIGTLVELFEFLEPEYAKFIVIGFDGSGNVIAVDNTDGKIYWLDHEDYFKATYMNESIEKMFECLVLFRRFNRENALAYTSGLDSVQKATLELNLANLRLELASVDALSVKEGFWRDELSYTIW